MAELRHNNHALPPVRIDVDTLDRTRSCFKLVLRLNNGLLARLG